MVLDHRGWLAAARLIMRGPLKVSRRVKWAAAGNLLVSAATGITWFFARTDEVLPRSLAWIPTLHGISAAVAVFSFGYFYGTHVTRALRQTRRRPTGYMLLGATVLAIGSGYSLYYLADESIRASMVYIHAVLATTLCFAAGLHARARKPKPKSATL